MAEKKASLIVELKDSVSKSLKGLNDSISDFKYSILAVAGAVTGFVAGLYSLAKSYMEQETAVNKLNMSMKNNGSYTAAASQDLQKFANELQRTTTISDETSLEMMALLGTFGLTGNELKKATMAAADLSKGLGVDLNTAALLLGKSFVGETSTLGRYGIKIDESIPKAERFSEVLSVLNTRFGGSATAELNTAAGRFANLGNQFDDLKEKLGQALLPILEKLAEWSRTEIESLGVLIEQFSNWEGVVATLGETLTTFFGNVLIGITSFIEAIPGASFLLEKMGLSGDVMSQKIQAAVDSVNGKIQNWANNAAAANTKVAASDNAYTANKLKNNASESVDEYKKLAEYVALQAAAIDAKKKMEDESLNRRIARDKLEQKMNDDYVTSWSNALNMISSLSSAKSKELAAIGKAAAIASIAISTQQGAMKAYAELGIFGGPAAAAIYVAGAVAAAKVAGVELADGGMVMPRSGGVSATIAEAGSAEAVIPLDDPETKEKLADVMGGNSITINAGTIIADNMSVREFAKRIDEELFSLQRNRQTVSI